MVAREIREDSGVELEPVNALLIETVRRDFHRHPPHSPINELTQNALELDRSRSGELIAAGNNLSFGAKQYSERPDRRASCSLVIEQMAKNSGSGAFSTRSGYAAHPQ